MSCFVTLCNSLNAFKCAVKGLRLQGGECPGQTSNFSCEEIFSYLDLSTRLVTSQLIAVVSY